MIILSISKKSNISQSHSRRFEDTRVILFSDTNQSVAACEYRRYVVAWQTSRRRRENTENSYELISI